MVSNRAATARNLSTGGGLHIDLLKRIGLAVRVARVGRGLSQRELAEKLNRSQNLIWGLESGRKDPGIILLKSISEVLDMPLDFFLIPIMESHANSTKDNKNNFNQGQNVFMSLMNALAQSNNDKQPTIKKKKRKASD